MTVIGAGSVTMLPIGLELACELTRNAGGSSALVWFGYVLVDSFLTTVIYDCNRNSGYLFGVVFVLRTSL